MKGVSNPMTIGERVAYYRRRRGLSQVTLADLVGRTESWVEKIENGRAALDRVSVISQLARALDVSLHDLLPDDVADVDIETRGQSVPALRELILSYRAVNARFAVKDRGVEAADAATLKRLVNETWSAFQDSQFGYVIMRLNQALPIAYVTAHERGAVRLEANRSLAYLYQVAASVLVKLGDLDLARVCADRGDIAVQTADDPVAAASLHALGGAHAAQQRAVRRRDRGRAGRPGGSRQPEHPGRPFRPWRIHIRGRARGRACR